MNLQIPIIVFLVFLLVFLIPLMTFHLLSRRRRFTVLMVLSSDSLSVLMIVVVRHGSILPVGRTCGVRVVKIFLNRRVRRLILTFLRRRTRLMRFIDLKLILMITKPRRPRKRRVLRKAVLGPLVSRRVPRRAKSPRPFLKKS